MGSQNLKYDCEEIVSGILEEFTEKLNLPENHPKSIRLKNIITETLTLNIINQKSDAIQLLAGQEFLSSLSEDLFTELFIVIPSWYYKIVKTFLQNIEISSDEQCLEINPENASACISAMTSFLCYVGKSSFDIPLHKNLTVSTIGLTTVENCYNHFISLNEFKQRNLKDKLCKLFQECKNLQRCILYFLEHTSLTAISNEDEVRNLLVTCSNLLIKLLILVSDVNPKETVPILRVFGVLLKDSSDYIKDDLDVSTFVEYLCNSTTKFNTRVLTSSEASLSKSNKAHIMRICNYQMKILILTCDKMSDNLDKAWPNLVIFLMYLIELTPKRRVLYEIDNSRVSFNLEGVNDEQKIINENVTVGMEPLLTRIISQREFVHFVLKHQDNSISHCLLIAHILDKIPDLEYDLFEMWLKYATDEGDNIITFLFKLIENLYFQLIYPVYVPAIMLNGKPPIFNSLYQHLCTHICAFFASIPAKYSSIIEDTLIYALLSNCVWLNILASDVWCFVSRYSTSNLCLEHCRVLLKLHLEFPDDYNVINLLGKLFSFLSKSHQLQFIKDYPVEIYPKLFSVLTTSDDIKIAVQKYYSRVKTHFQSESFASDNEMTISSKLDLIQLFQAHLPNTLVSSNASKFLSNCLSDILTYKNTFQEWFLRKIASCVYFMTKNVEFNATTQNIGQILLSLKDCTVTNFDNDVNSRKSCLDLIVLLLLKNLSSKSLPQTLLSEIPSFFTWTLQSDNRVLKLICFEVLSLFARVTPHKMLVKSILNPDLKANFARFLQQIPSKKVLSLEEVESVASFMFNKKSYLYVYENDEDEEKCDQPFKKQKMDNISPSSSLINNTIAQLEEVMKTVEKTWLENNLSSSDCKKIRVIAEKMLEYV